MSEFRAQFLREEKNYSCKLGTNKLCISNVSLDISWELGAVYSEYAKKKIEVNLTNFYVSNLDVWSKTC